MSFLIGFRPISDLQFEPMTHISSGSESSLHTAESAGRHEVASLEGASSEGDHAGGPLEKSGNASDSSGP